MLTFLERYQDGEHAQVWQELVALGDAVIREPLRTDANAVAQETMRRARHNIELLVERLQKLGFELAEPNAVFAPPSPETLKEITRFERKVGPVPLSLRAWAEIVGSVNLMGTYPRLSYYAANSNPLLAMGNMFGGVQQIDLASLLKGGQFPFGGAGEAGQNSPDNMVAAMQNALNNLMSGIGAGAQNKATKPEQEIAGEDQAISDPLMFDVEELSVDYYEEWREYQGEDEPFCITVAPDIHHKSNISGSDGYEIRLPLAAADAPLRNTEWGELTFVEYLRLSFEWAGFPGLQDYERRDEALIAQLKEGLLPL